MRQGWLGDNKQENSQNPLVGSKRFFSLTLEMQIKKMKTVAAE